MCSLDLGYMLCGLDIIVHYYFVSAQLTLIPVTTQLELCIKCIKWQHHMTFRPQIFPSCLKSMIHLFSSSALCQDISNFPLYQEVFYRGRVVYSSFASVGENIKRSKRCLDDCVTVFAAVRCRVILKQCFHPWAQPIGGLGSHNYRTWCKDMVFIDSVHDVSMTRLTHSLKSD